MYFGYLKQGAQLYILDLLTTAGCSQRKFGYLGQGAQIYTFYISDRVLRDIVWISKQWYNAHKESLDILGRVLKCIYFGSLNKGRILTEKVWYLRPGAQRYTLDISDRVLIDLVWISMALCSHIDYKTLTC